MLIQRGSPPAQKTRGGPGVVLGSLVRKEEMSNMGGGKKSGGPVSRAKLRGARWNGSRIS